MTICTNQKKPKKRDYKITSYHIW